MTMSPKQDEKERRDAIKRLDKRIAAGETRTPQGESLMSIRNRLLANYEMKFGKPYAKPRTRVSVKKEVQDDHKPLAN